MAFTKSLSHLRYEKHDCNLFTKICCKRKMYKLIAVLNVQFAKYGYIVSIFIFTIIRVNGNN